MVLQHIANTLVPSPWSSLPTGLKSRAGLSPAHVTQGSGRLHSGQPTNPGDSAVALTSHGSVDSSVCPRPNTDDLTIVLTISNESHCHRSLSSAIQWSSRAVSWYSGSYSTVQWPNKQTTARPCQGLRETYQPRDGMIPNRPRNSS